MSAVWETFYSPHSDDESLSMAGAIARAVAGGRSTIVVLVTDNLPSARGARLFPIDSLAEQRRSEWLQAMRVLGVTETEEWNVDEQQIATCPFEVQHEIARRIQNVHARYGPVHHHTVWGANDVHIESGLSSISHIACANAAASFHTAFPETRVTLHGVYVYSRPLADRSAPLVSTLSESEMQAKRAALACYKTSDTAIGYGYASVPELFDAAETDPHEYLIEVA